MDYVHQQYIICDPITGKTEVDLYISPDTHCAFYRKWIEGSVRRTQYKQTWAITLDKPAVEDFRVNYQYTLTEYQTDLPPAVSTLTSRKTFPSGHTQYKWDVICIDASEDYGEDAVKNHEGQWIDDYYVVELTDFLVLLQSDIPECVTQEPGCEIDIVSATSTAPSIRGEDDGTITIVVSGATGTTVNYKLDGVNYAIGSTSITGITYTGLTAGVHTTTVEQGICFANMKVTVEEGEFRTQPFLVNDPPYLTASENPIILNIQTAATKNIPATAQSKFVVIGTILNDLSITFNLTYPIVYNPVFKAKTFPDRPNYFLAKSLTDEIGTVLGSNSNTEIATSIAEAFQNDSILNRLYYITSTGATVTLDAKETGDLYSLSPSMVKIVGTGITFTDIENGISQYDGQLTNDYSIYVEIFNDDSLEYGSNPYIQDFRRIAELELPYNRTNQHKFDLSNVLKNFVSSPKFDFGMTGNTSTPTMTTPYYCKFGEKYPLIENSTTKKKRYKGMTDVKYVINSSLDYNLPNNMTGYLGNQYAPSGTTLIGVKFLNTAPNPKYISRGSKEFLYFLLGSEYPHSLDLVGRVEFYNGTVLTGETFFNIASGATTNLGGVNIVACGYDELGLESLETAQDAKIRKVQFYIKQTISPGWIPTVAGETVLKGTSIAMTETKSYLLEIDEQVNRYDVAFLNDLGTYETFSFVGEVIEDQEINRKNYQIGYDVDNYGAAQYGFQYNSVYDTQMTRLVTVNTGTMDSDTYDYVQQLLRSNNLYNYSSTYQNFLTIVSQTSTKSTNNNEYTTQVTFRETIQKNNVSK